jgi:hypothetical protein
VETSASLTGDDWAGVPAPFLGGWVWTPFQGAFTGADLAPPPDADPFVLSYGPTDETLLPPVSGPEQPAIGARLWQKPEGTDELQVLASRSFLDAVGGQVGDRITASVLTRPFQAQVAGVVERLPPYDPAEPFLVVDWPTMAIRELVQAGDAPGVSEWWLATGEAREADVIRAIDPAQIGAAAVTGRSSLAGRLSANPFGVGILGALVIGVLTVTVIGTIGFVVSTLASIEERLDEFSILEALGLSARQLGAWMALESLLVVSISVVAGLILGTVLAWMVLPAASMTADGSTPVPPPVLVIPWVQLAALAAGAFLVAGASTFVARRQLARFAVNDALRGDA